MTNGYLKFTGEYSQLKQMGYEFQKLYAANYMQWHKNGLRIFKRGSDIVHSNINLYKLVKFMRGVESPKHVRNYDNHIGFYKFYSNDRNGEYEYYPTTEENVQKYNDNLTLWGNVVDGCPEDKLPQCMSTELVERSMLIDLQTLNKLGWYELVDC